MDSCLKLKNSIMQNCPIFSYHLHQLKNISILFICKGVQGGLNTFLGDLVLSNFSSLSMIKQVDQLSKGGIGFSWGQLIVSRGQLIVLWGDRHLIHHSRIKNKQNNPIFHNQVTFPTPKMAPAPYPASRRLGITYINIMYQNRPLTIKRNMKNVTPKFSTPPKLPLPLEWPHVKISRKKKLPI